MSVGITCRWNSALLLTITTLFTAQVGMSAEPTATKVSKRVVPQKQFCDGMMAGLTRYASSEGLTPRNALKFASSTSQVIQKQLRNGDIDPYFDVTFLRSSFSSDPSARRWIDVSMLVTAAMGVAPKNVLIVTSTDELKMVSQAAPGSQILLIAASMGPLNADRAHSVAESAQFGKIQINIIWVGSSGASTREAKDALAFLANATNGSFLDLGNANACSGV